MLSLLCNCYNDIIFRIKILKSNTYSNIQEHQNNRTRLQLNATFYPSLMKCCMAGKNYLTAGVSGYHVIVLCWSLYFLWFIFWYFRNVFAKSDLLSKTRRLLMFIQIGNMNKQTMHFIFSYNTEPRRILTLNLISVQIMWKWTGFMY